MAPAEAIVRAALRAGFPLREVEAMLGDGLVVRESQNVRVVVTVRLGGT
jgi:hypothetical protein